MTDYISREAAKEKCCSLCRWEGTANCEECEHPIDDIPAADVRPVVRGKWAKKNDDVCYWFECSVCGQRPPWNEWGTEWQSPFCPNCGADMRPHPPKEE